MHSISDYHLVVVVAALVLGLVLAAALWLGLRRRSRAPTAAEPRPLETPAPQLRDTLTRTRQGLLTRLRTAWDADKDTEGRLAELEEALLAADIGPKATQQLLATLRPLARQLPDAEALRDALGDRMRAILQDGATPPVAAAPYLILVAGVNGVGKTTTIGKLAHLYRRTGRKVLLVAGDTFRAAAGEQLEHWAQRVGATCIRHQAGSDPSAVAFDGAKAAVARGIDVVIVDTAGRLHVKAHLMEELKKIARVIGRQIEGAPHEILLVIDATTGQNAVNQARVFCEALPVTGIVLTKLDGTAKGGAVFAVRSELGVPIRYVGVGERPEDLAPFDPDAFVDALLAAN